jgi:alpha-D-ribose 1-methylphosphonate 5-triphosphate diphosphatase
LAPIEDYFYNHEHVLSCAEMAHVNAEFVISNAKIVTADEVFFGSVVIQDGLIAEIRPGPYSHGVEINFNGDYLLPGMIDLHTDNLEKHVMPRNNAAWPIMSAFIAHDAQISTAGITTVLDSLCIGASGLGVRSFDTARSLIATIEAGARTDMFRAEHLLHLRAEISNPETPKLFEQVFGSPALRMVSLMDHTPGQRQWANLDAYVAMEKRDFKLSDEEIEAFLKKTREHHEKYSDPNRCELIVMVDGLDIALASHDDTTLRHVEQAHEEGIHISEFPTTALAARAARERGIKIIAGAPNLVLGRSHSGNVSAIELAREGLLDALASDYAPSSLLHGAFLLEEQAGLSLHEAVQMVSLVPAKMIGLEDRGTIESGRRADLLRVQKVDNLPIVRMVWREGRRVA